MVRKCSIIGCKTGYDPEKKNEALTVHVFPKCEKKLKEWLSAIPCQSMKTNKVTVNMGICSRHWPRNAKRQYAKGKLIPDEPPSLNLVDIETFSNNSTEDFFQKLKIELKKLELGDIYQQDTKHYFFVLKGRNPIFDISIIFILSIRDNHVMKVSLEAYKGIQKVIDYSNLKCWRELSDVLNSIKLFDCVDHGPSHFIERQVQLLNTTKTPDTPFYNSEDMCHAFAWYTESRSLYINLRKFMMLPSVSTLHRMARRTKNMTEFHLSTNNCFDKQVSYLLFIYDFVLTFILLFYISGLPLAKLLLLILLK